MARARNIKPSFFTNDNLAECEPLARLLFIGLWTISDHKGDLECRLKKIKAEILPYDDCDINSLITQLMRYGFLEKYTIEDVSYFHIVNFTKHQNPHKNEIQKGSDIPEYNPEIVTDSEITINHDKNGTTQDKDETNPADSFFLIPDSPFPHPDSLNPIPPKKKPAVLELPDWLDLELWGNFVEHRKFIKAPMSIQAAKINLTSLEKLTSKGYSQAEIINLAIGSGWKGFYEPKGNQNASIRPNNQYHRPTQGEQAEDAITRLGEK